MEVQNDWCTFTAPQLNISDIEDYNVNGGRCKSREQPSCVHRTHCSACLIVSLAGVLSWPSLKVIVINIWSPSNCGLRLQLLVSEAVIHMSLSWPNCFSPPKLLTRCEWGSDKCDALQKDSICDRLPNSHITFFLFLGIGGRGSHSCILILLRFHQVFLSKTEGDKESQSSSDLLTVLPPRVTRSYITATWIRF